MTTATWATSSDYIGVSCKQNPSTPANVYFNNPMDTTVPQRRFGMQPAVNTGGTWNYYNGGVPLPAPPPAPPYPVNYPYSYPTIAASYPSFPSNAGADQLLTDVISFEVDVFTPSTGDFTDLSKATGSALPVPPNNTNLLAAGGLLATTPYVFDTWSSQKDDVYDYSGWNATTASDTTAPLQTTISAVKITLRVFDKKTQRARQVTFVQDM